jgi:alginate O-acetyltransferase complex protein AlgI
MLFNSFEFLLFLPVVYILYWFVFNKSLNKQNILILVASYFFYGWWSWKFLGLLALSTFIDYSFGFLVDSANKKRAKLFLILCVINNLGILAIFKYYNFFAVQVQAGLELIGFNVNHVLIGLMMPVGISFYTFHGMSYVFDIYNDRQKPIRSLVDYSVFVSFFPLLVAGPIERANHLLPQVQLKKRFNYEQSSGGIRLMLWGMFKKVVIADGIAPHVNAIFENSGSESGLSLIFGAILFSFQIYCDFSGYSDIAIGTAKIFGFELLSNFKFPYFSRDIAEFWRRWHISLSSWFRDYLYIPLGGSKNGKWTTLRNTFIIFIVSGFWHGANWTYIVWGAVHAFAFVPLLITKKNRNYTSEVVAFDRKYPNLKEISQMVLTFSLVTLAWIFFRANSVPDAFGILERIFTFKSSTNSKIDISTFFLLFSLYIIPLIVLDWAQRRNERELFKFKYNWVLYTIFLILIVHSWITNDNSNFIYFQF